MVVESCSDFLLQHISDYSALAIARLAEAHMCRRGLAFAARAYIATNLLTNIMNQHSLDVRRLPVSDRLEYIASSRLQSAKPDLLYRV